MPAVAGAQSGIEPVDCTGPAPEAKPGTPAWHQRELDNAYCATQRELDAHSNPLYTAAQANRPPSRAATAMDPMREPTLLDGQRFRFDASPFASPANWLNILFLGAGASALCFVTWNWSVGVLGAVKTSAYIYMVPVITIAASVVILQEKLTWVAFCGGALTLAGLYISETKPKPQLKEEQI